MCSNDSGAILEQLQEQESKHHLGLRNVELWTDWRLWLTCFYLTSLRSADVISDVFLFFRSWLTSTRTICP